MVLKRDIDLTNPLEVGPAIRELRVGRGLSQTAFGKQLGVTKNTIIRWEKGVTLPKMAILDSIGLAGDGQEETMPAKQPTTPEEAPWNAGDIVNIIGQTLRAEHHDALDLVSRLPGFRTIIEDLTLRVGEIIRAIPKGELARASKSPLMLNRLVQYHLEQGLGMIFYTENKETATAIASYLGPIRTGTPSEPAPPDRLPKHLTRKDKKYRPPKTKDGHSVHTKEEGSSYPIKEGED